VSRPPSVEDGARARVAIQCPAKVNLFLRVLAREDTGYHQIETLFQAIGLYDRVEAQAGDPGIALHVVPGETAAGLGDLVSELRGRDDNTVMRAAHAFFNDTRPNYQERAARDAWRRTLAFLREHLA